MAPYFPSSGYDSPYSRQVKDASAMVAQACNQGSGDFVNPGSDSRMEDTSIITTDRQEGQRRGSRIKPVT